MTTHKNRITSILGVLMIVLLVSSCQSVGNPETTAEKEAGAEGKETEETKYFVRDYDDSNTLDKILTAEYGLQDLLNFFGEINSNESCVYGSSGLNMTENLTIDAVNEKFPIECLRSNSYTVYKVEEGGCFYVFWDVCSEASYEEAYDATVYFTAYLSSSAFKEASDFDSIQENVSTAEDVAKIDPSFELNFLMSSKTPSYSLLQDGSVMEICYKWDDSFNSRKDLIVKSKEIISKEESPSCLARILEKDLPF